MTEDHAGVARSQSKERRKGEPQAKAPTHVFRHNPPPDDVAPTIVERVFAPETEAARTTSEALDETQLPTGDPVDTIEEIEERMLETPGLGPDAGASQQPASRRLASWGRRNPFEDDNPWA